MAQPGFALVLYKLDGGSAVLGSIKDLYDAYYHGATGAYTYGPVELWTGRAWLKIGIAKTDDSRHANVIKLYPSASTLEVKMYTTGGGAVYVGTESMASVADTKCRLLNKSYKNSVSSISTVDIGLLPYEFITGYTDHNPLGYPQNSVSFSGSLSLGAFHDLYVIDTTINPITGAVAGGDTDGVYWSHGVIVDCEATA